MAPPPRYVIARKLTRKWFKNYVPKIDTDTFQGDFQMILDCLQRFGDNNNICAELEAQLEQKIDNMITFKSRFMKQGLKNEVLNNLRRPDYKIVRRGRHKQEEEFQHKHPIYNGLI